MTKNRDKRKRNLKNCRLRAAGLGAALLCLALLCACSAGRAEDAVQLHPFSSELDLRDQALPAIETLAAQQGLTQLDLRGHEIAPEDVARLEEALPGCEILWSVPIGGKRYDCAETALACDALSETDIALLQYFPSLASLDARGSKCYAALADYAATHPACTVLWTVPLFGVKAESTDGWLDLNGRSVQPASQLLERLAYLPALTDVSLVGCELSTEEKAALRLAYPALRFYWTLDFPDAQYRSTDEKLDFTVVNFDGVEELATVVQCFLNPRIVDVATHGFEDSEMEALSARFPETKFVWTVRVGKYTIRTDVKVFNGRAAPGDRLLRDADIEPLRYCTDLEALNLSRQALTDISPLRTLTKLRVLVLSQNKITDLSPLSDLKQLEYLEAYKNGIADLSPLSDMPALLDLNLASNAVVNVSPLLKSASLERVYLSGNGVAEDSAQAQALKKALPDAELDFTATNMNLGWASHDRYGIVEGIWDSRVMHGLEPETPEEAE